MGDLDCCLVVDLRFGRNIIDVVATAYQKAIRSVIELLHASDTSCLVEVREAAYADPPALFNSHSFYSHRSLCLGFKFFSLFVKLIELLRQGWPFFVQANDCGHKGT